jgi:rhamnogalacturonyl hydrolase YesR
MKSTISMKSICGYLLTANILIWPVVNAQKPSTVKNDVTAPLHALQPDYPVPYKAMQKDEIKRYLDKVFNYLNNVTPARMINKSTGIEVKDISELDTNTIVEQKDFRLTSYEWGVTYSALQRATETSGDKKYADYVKTRFDFLAKWIPAIKEKFALEYIQKKRFLNQPIDPHALDDAGAVCAAMIKAQRSGLNNNLHSLIDNYINYVFTKEYRLTDGTIARNRPQKNTLWLDDLYMAIPAIAQMGKLTGETKYFDDAVSQVKLYAQRMFNKDKNLYMHGWVESMETHPEFRWARANGWALMAKIELLDVLPENHPGRNFVLEQLKAHVKGLGTVQGGSGFWHQLLDREDSYLETSATAIYAYCVAHACNKGWLDPMIYGPMSLLAWNAVTTKINEKGQVEGTCVGTGMAFDPLFYYHRPVNVYAAHGYGPVILAGAEMIELVKNYSFYINDSSLQLKEKNK